MNSLPLWKICRILANDLRLNMLMLLRHNSPQCVKAIAKELGVSENTASKNLKRLSAAGFVMQKFRGKFLFCTLAVEDDLLSTVLELTQAERNDQVLFLATALTHERRVRILQALRTHPLRLEQICLKTQISWEAMRRQIKKLERRGLVQLTDERYALKIPSCSFGKLLIDQAMKEITPSKV